MSATWGILSRIKADSLEEASDQMRSWSMMQYTHLEAGPAEMRGFVLGLGPVLVGQWSGSRSKILKTSVPSGSLAMLIPTQGLARLGTTSLEPGSGLAGGPGADVTLFTGRHFEGVLVSIAETRLLDFLASCSIDLSPQSIGTRTLSVPATQARMLVQLSLAIAAAAERAPSAFPAAGRLAALEDRVLLVVAETLAHLGRTDHEHKPTADARHRAADRPREIIDANLQQPLSHPPICKAPSTSAPAHENP